MSIRPFLLAAALGALAVAASAQDQPTAGSALYHAFYQEVALRDFAAAAESYASVAAEVDAKRRLSSR